MVENWVTAKKERATTRDSVTKFINKIETLLLNDTDTDILNVEETLEQLNETSVELRKSDKKIKKN